MTFKDSKTLVKVFFCLFLLFIGCVDSPTDSRDNSSLTLSDGDGNTYTTVQIGNQLWTVENWRSTSYSCGTPIPHIHNSTNWENLSTPAFCFYDNTNDTEFIKKYGALYNWWVVDRDNPYDIAPRGWRVPTYADWNILIQFLVSNGYNWDGTAEENKIGKALASEGGEWGWDDEEWHEGWGPIEAFVGYNQSSNNRTGFSALPSGYREFDYGFDGIGWDCVWWSATEYSHTDAYVSEIWYDGYGLSSDRYDKRDGYSIRLVRDVD